MDILKNLIAIGHSLNNRYMFIVSIAVILSVVGGSLVFVGGTPNTIAQYTVNPEDIVSPGQVTITDNIFGTCLEVSYSWYGGTPDVEETGDIIGLILSLDNVTWTKVAQHTLSESELHSNTSRTFRICNSLTQPFPFDVERGKTIYIGIEFEYGSGWNSEDSPNVQLYLTAIVVPKDITRLWYFTMDWTLPGIFGALFLCALSIFLMSRYNRRKLEKRRGKSED